MFYCQFSDRIFRFTPLVFFRFWSIIYKNEGAGEAKMKKITLKALAEQSGFSQRTLFRILRNDPQVKASTRDAVIHLLNIHGYMVQSSTENEKVVVDVSIDNLYSEQIARKVFKRLQLENYETVLTDSLRHPATLRKELEDADAVVFSGLQRDDWFRIARDINPSIYRVSLFCEGSVTTNG
ncbi:LacI family DNA-binding transcriptional regulator [bacterium]|nr:LacI family DNA-binding transcriptional regulator [bacterium]